MASNDVLTKLNRYKQHKISDVNGQDIINNAVRSIVSSVYSDDFQEDIDRRIKFSDKFQAAAYKRQPFY